MVLNKHGCLRTKKSIFGRCAQSQYKSFKTLTCLVVPLKKELRNDGRGYNCILCFIWTESFLHGYL
eukprot:scaffold44_cov339-Pavlova_lutheri.AAC.5